MIDAALNWMCTMMYYVRNLKVGLDSGNIRWCMIYVRSLKTDV